jgi:hypothetical protein
MPTTGPPSVVLPQSSAVVNHVPPALVYEAYSILRLGVKHSRSICLRGRGLRLSSGFNGMLSLHALEKGATQSIDD